MTNVIASRRPQEGLSRRSPAGRTFAFEFSRIRGIAPVLEKEIAARLEQDADFRLMQQSGMGVAADPIRVGQIVLGRDRTPAGILGYKLGMPDGVTIRQLAKEVRIYLGPDGCPIFQVGKCRFNDLNSAAILMSAAIRYLLTKE